MDEWGDDGLSWSVLNAASDGKFVYTGSLSNDSGYAVETLLYEYGLRIDTPTLKVEGGNP